MGTRPKTPPLTDLAARERAAECLKVLAHPHHLRDRQPDGVGAPAADAAGRLPPPRRAQPAARAHAMQWRACGRASRRAFATGFPHDSQRPKVPRSIRSRAAVTSASVSSSV